MNDKRLVTLRELQKLIYPRYSERWLRELSQNGVIPREHKIGRFWMYDAEKVQTALNAYQPESPEIPNERLDPLSGIC